MICFHSLNYWYLQQQLKISYLYSLRCDLLSFFELLIFTTTRWVFHSICSPLWFAFILWTTDIYNNIVPIFNLTEVVVICFHSLNYWYLQQPGSTRGIGTTSCDLLSFFELLIFTTTVNALIPTGLLLWFAFILWTTDIYNNLGTSNTLYPSVVICFHSLNYWYLQQQTKSHNPVTAGCDLLSFFELLIFTTTRLQKYLAYPLLWFAFILWTTDIYNNIWSKVCLSHAVVICFHSLNYWYLQQRDLQIVNASTGCDLLSFFELLIFTTTFPFLY